MPQRPASRSTDPVSVQIRGLGDRQAQELLVNALIARHTPSTRKVPPPIPCARLMLIQDDQHHWLAGHEEVVVRNADADRAQAALQRAGFRERIDGRLVARFVRTGAGRDTVEAVVRRLRKNGIDAGPNLVHVTGQMRMKGAALPATAPFALGSRPRSTAGRGVKVAVVDTGIWSESPQRGDGWLDGIAVSRANTDPLDQFSADGPGSNGLLDWGAGHGTFVAGLVRQIAPAAEVTVVRALDSAGVGTDAEVADAIVAAAKGGADIIHCSFAGPAFENVPPIALTEAMRVVDPRVLIVAAAGNDGSDKPMYPAAFKRVVAVGALSADGSPAAFSNRGWWIDASTVGEGLVSTFVDGTDEPLRPRQAPTEFTGPDPVAMWSGTSFSAPQVTGAVAVELAKMRRRRGGDLATARDAFDRLVTGAPQIPDLGAQLAGVTQT
jgi:thermitase